MTDADLQAIANELQCGPPQTITTFARVIARHCALVAAGAGERGVDASQAIRDAFGVAP